MRSTRSKPPLKIVSPAVSYVSPPRKLGEHGMKLWTTMTRAYDISDDFGMQALHLACAALDRAESCRERINADGEAIQTPGGLKDHPLLRHEAVARAFVVKTLAALGLNSEPLRQGPGRPPGYGY